MTIQLEVKSWFMSNDPRQEKVGLSADTSFILETEHLLSIAFMVASIAMTVLIIIVEAELAALLIAVSSLSIIVTSKWSLNSTKSFSNPLTLSKAKERFKGMSSAANNFGWNALTASAASIAVAFLAASFFTIVLASTIGGGIALLSLDTMIALKTTYTDENFTKAEAWLEKYRLPLTNRLPVKALRDCWIDNTYVFKHLWFALRENSARD